MQQSGLDRSESVRGKSPGTAAAMDTPEPPFQALDGGRTAWIQVAMCWIVLFATWGLINSFGAFQLYYESALNVPAWKVSMIGSVQNWMTFFVGAFSGRLLDLGYLRISVLVGLLLQMLGIFLASISGQYWSLMLTHGLLTGLGGGILFCPAVALVATYFERKRALAIGVASTGISIGGAIYPLLVQQLLPSVKFGWTMRVLGLLNLTGLTVVLIFARQRTTKRSLLGHLIVLSPLLRLSFLLIVGGIALNVWLVYFMFYYIPEFSVQRLQASTNQAILQGIIFNAIGIPARLIVPLCADRWGLFNTLVPVLVLNSATAYCWLAVKSLDGFRVYVYFAGLINAAFQCLMPTAVSKLASNVSDVGGTVGLGFTILSLFALSGPPIGGAILSRENGYAAATVWAASAGFVGSLSVYFGRSVLYSWSWRKTC